MIVVNLAGSIVVLVGVPLQLLLHSFEVEHALNEVQLGRSLDSLCLFRFKICMFIITVIAKASISQAELRHFILGTHARF